ncbi:hypothetical protein BS78_02G285800 [Paspalum vaginatum]|nr:hypothetical protein BS78_02G285800 [Paspalum vaginatum]
MRECGPQLYVDDSQALGQQYATGSPPPVGPTLRWRAHKRSPSPSPRARHPSSGGALAARPPAARASTLRRRRSSARIAPWSPICRRSDASSLSMERMQTLLTAHGVPGRGEERRRDRGCQVDPCTCLVRWR